MKQKGSPRFARVEAGLAPILIILLIAAAIGGYLIYSGKINLNKDEVRCTKEAKICPDGSSVGRVGPNCEFAACPTTPDETANWKTYTNSVLGFSFSYPKELNYLYDQFGFNHPENPEGKLLLQNYDGSNPTKKDPANFQLVIDAYKNVNKVALEKFVKDPNKVWNIGNSQAFTPFMLDGKSAYKGESIQKSKKVPAVWMENNGYILTIYLETPESSNAAWFDKILSTFKFTK